MVSRSPLACVAPLFVPADRQDRFGKAAASGADAVFIDLEDAVAPDAKIQAREGLRAFTPLAVPAFVRVNASATQWHDEDVAMAAALPLAGIILPKAQSADEIRRLRARIDPQQAMIALIETAEGLARVREIAHADKAIRLAFGSMDFCADLGCAHTREALLLARSELVLASRLGSLLPPLDGVTAETNDTALVENDARYAAELGFAGKLCIHPRQVAAAYEGFAPSAEELRWAYQVLATEEAGAVSMNGQMIDAPVRRRAELLIARANIAGRKTNPKV